MFLGLPNNVQTMASTRDNGMSLVKEKAEVSAFGLQARNIMGIGTKIIHMDMEFF